MTDTSLVLHSESGLEHTLKTGNFAVTAELGPADSSNPQDVLDNAALFGHTVDAINVTDASGAHCHISSVAASAILARAGYEPVMQISCRDRNRIAMQGDIVGAAALGIHNILMLTGDGVQTGDHPQAKPVFDMDSIHLIRTGRTLRDQGTFLSGRELKTPPRVFLGGAANPFAPPQRFRAQRLAKKVQAGADFVQTQYCFDMPMFEAFMQQVRDMSLHHRVFILVGVGPLRSANAARWMRNNVPGVWIPDHIIDRLDKTPKKQQKREGQKICAEIIQQVREIEGVAGIHIMAYKQEASIPQILTDAGIPVRQVTQPRYA
jgi:5,10-methylenetetrahydrofolate reductase